MVIKREEKLAKFVLISEFVPGGGVPQGYRAILTISILHLWKEGEKRPENVIFCFFIFLSFLQCKILSTPWSAVWGKLLSEANRVWLWNWLCNTI